jgi:UDP-N-acetylglucosamine 4-epimerase
MTDFASIKQSLGDEPKSWLITGVAGFIGSALLDELLGCGQRVVGIDNFATGHRHNLDEVLAKHPGADYRFIEGDITGADACRDACEGIDIVLHQAALGSVPRSIDNPQATHEANVDGFVNVILAARDAGASRFVYASSSSVYGDDDGLPKIEARVGTPLSPYAATKKIGEIYARVFQDCYGLECVGLRYFNVFGPRQDPDGPYAAVIPRWIQRLLGGETCEIYGDGKNSRDFTFVANAIQANLLAGTGPASATGRVYNVGYGDAVSLTELFGSLRREIARHQGEAEAARASYSPPRKGDIAHSQASTEAIRDALGYVPTHDLGQGLALTVEWFLGHKE